MIYLTLWLPAAIAGGAALAGGIVNATSQQNMNRKNRAFSREMYQRQKDDNLAFWAQQNTYNSPAEQMKRFKEAGLNPNLIYGQGNAGNAGPIATPDAQAPNTRAPEWGSGIAAGGQAGVQAYFDTQIKSLTANNLQKQGDVLTEDAKLRAAQTYKTLLEVDRGKWDFDFEKSLQQVSADFRRALLREKNVSTDIALSRNNREGVKMSFDIAESIARVNESRLRAAKTSDERQQIQANINEINSRISNLRRDGTLKDIEIKLRQKGINPNDPMYQRIIGQAIDGIIENPLDLSAKIKKLKDDIWNWAF